MSRRLPDGRWVHRVRRANARWDAAWRRRAILPPEIVPFVEVEIVPANPKNDGPVVDVVIVPKQAELSSSLVNLTISSFLKSDGER